MDLKFIKAFISVKIWTQSKTDLKIIKQRVTKRHCRNIIAINYEYEIRLLPKSYYLLKVKNIVFCEELELQRANL